MIRRRSFLVGLGGVVLGAGLRAECSSEAGKLVLSPPTGQCVLDGSVRQGVFMDTGTGRPESGMFGNTRKYADGSPRFHEGIDIAPVQPWRRDRNPTDVVRASAPGLVVYINQCRQNASLYGNYVVLTHEVPSFGVVYTLYAHLRRIDRSLKAGQQVPAGRALGIMGHTPDFPLARAHLHFEVGVVMNRHYPLIDAQHGVWNGANLYGVDPCVAFTEQRRNGAFDIAAYLVHRPIAWGVQLEPGPRPDFFRRYPLFWRGEYRESWPMWVAFSREGIPVHGQSIPPGVSIAKQFRGSSEELRKGRNWANPERGRILLENLLVSPSRSSQRFTRLGEVG